LVNSLTSELLVDLALPSQARVSPDGTHAVVAVTTTSKKGEHPESTIWIAPTDGSSPARQLTSGLANDTAPRWSPDSKRICFLSDRAERGTSQLYVLSLDGGEALPLTDEPGGVAEARWLPGDTPRIAWLAIDARDKDEMKRRKDERNDANVYGEFWPYARLRVTNPDSGETRKYDIGDQHIASFEPSPDGNRLALWLLDVPDIDEGLDRCQLALLDLETGELETVGDRAFHPNSVAWSLDGTELTYVGRGGKTAVSSTQAWQRNLIGDDPPICVTPDLEACVGDIVRVRETGELLAIIVQGTESWLGRIDTGSGEVEKLQHYHGDLTSLSVSDDGKIIVALGSTPDRPADVVVLAGEGGARRITNFHTVLDDVELGEQEIITWHRNGFDLDGILIWPPGRSRADGPMPTIVSLHGGPYGRWPNSFINGPFGRRLAQEGYLVFLPNPRGGRGHGQAFAEAVLYSVGDEDYLDIMAGVDLLVEQGLADPDRLGCGGWSQGGFMTAWIIGQTDRFKAGVMGAGISDWGMMIATSDIPSYENLMGGGNPYTSAGPHSFDKQSPISYVHRARTPTLIVHGENDVRVPVSQAIFMHRGLRAHNVPTELVTYPREPHGIQERNHQLDLQRRVVEWYRRWVPVE
jgi:dipeptidyl aminopeptidase/acylaminoacyl peptidase